MDKKVLETKIAYLVAWFIPVVVLLICFYRFAIKPSIWLLIFSCIMSVWIGWLLESYLEV